MSEPFLGEIRMFGGNFAPQGWSFCDGSLVAISQYDALFSLMGTTYGGDGVQTFGLPDLRGRVPVHMGNRAGTNYQLGQLGGSENVTLVTSQLPAHTHQARGASLGDSPSPSGKYWSTDPGGNVGAYNNTSPVPSPAAMSGASLSPAGGSQPHENMQPFLAITYIIAMEGIYPSQN